MTARGARGSDGGHGQIAVSPMPQWSGDPTPSAGKVGGGTWPLSAHSAHLKASGFPSGAHSWILATFPGWGAATMYDNNDQPKPAYDAAVSALGGSFSGGGSTGSARAVAAGKCLDVPGSSTTAGTQVQI